jgi:enoyl-CoA hydratase/carnithine racemase
VSKKVIFENIDGVGILTIKRPEALNALNREIVDEIDKIISEIEADSRVRVLIITGEGNFAAGADINAMVEYSPEEAAAFSFSSTFNKIAALQFPTIAVIEGYALGAGLELALSCDFRIASKKSKMGLPEITLGIMPGAGATIRLPRLVGESRAMEMILFGNVISAEQAQEMDLVSLVAEPDQLMGTALEWADKLKTKPLVAMKKAKQTIRQGLSAANIEEGIEIEAKNWAELFDTEDQKEGMKAFIEKRKPNYKGK